MEARATQLGVGLCHRKRREALALAHGPPAHPPRRAAFHRPPAPLCCRQRLIGKEVAVSMEYNRKVG